MLVEIFRCRKKSGAYLYLEKGAKHESLPEALLALTGELEFSFSFLLTPDRDLAQASAEVVIRALEENGYYLQMPPSPEVLANIPNAKL